MSGLLALLDEQDNENLLNTLSRIGPIIVSAHQLSNVSLPDRCSWCVLVDQPSSYDQQQAVRWLDDGADKIILPLSWAKEVIGVIPSERVLLLIDAANVSAVSDVVRNGVSGVLLKTSFLDLDLVSSISRFFGDRAMHVLSNAPLLPSASAIRGIQDLGAIPVLCTSQLTVGASSASQISVADAFLASVVSDRTDGLFPTVVTSETGHALGLVYSSVESVRESILTGKGVYHSRKHGLWRKGETSGATQDVLRIRLDCDSDALEFTVVQHGAGFCHLNRPSCFGEAKGLMALESTLRSRLERAPAGSYTRRLFDDPELLHSKIMEEAGELCQAVTREEVAFEAADLLYFALARCVAAGVGIADLERSLDRKAKKITRRPGNAKSAQAKAQNVPPPPTSQSIDTSAPIRMQKYALASVTAEERSRLLRRPVLRFDEMLVKVRPIVEDVRNRGDAALLELTEKFDNVKLSNTVLRPPFSPAALSRLDPAVRAAIDAAYTNIRTFHAAQTERPLVVETLPGVVCTRFSRPIARVGLYVPGGTAVLPSTALMLGVPAQVAGCREIVFATPPRPDGSVSPEVLYVASLVSASAVLIAGGAQAIAALAYGTASVPKVDKIFGPGNQWVTAAKMLVQNDTDALVSIDMPAGPSEVLVIADHASVPAFVAADLLSQAEHGTDSQVVLVTVDLPAEGLRAIEEDLDAQARALSRVDIIRHSIAKSIIVQTTSVEEALAFSNDYAPEHLILHIKEPKQALALVENAGSVFLGPYSPESCGDYASGTNHTLPTNGYARQFSGVSTLSFQKHITSQEITPSGLQTLGPVVTTLADCEGLDAHANAVRIRLRTSM